MQNKLSIRFYLKRYCSFILLTVSFQISSAQLLPGFHRVAGFPEQEINLLSSNDMTININAPLRFSNKNKTYLVLYALPNGNSIEWTKGKKIKPGDDWHFDIQHIAAQLRFVRNLDKKNNYIIVYLMAEQKSWPVWKRSFTGSADIIKNTVDSLWEMFKEHSPKIILNGHSGGGSFIFGYIDAVENIAGKIEHIAFLDSDYGYEDSMHTKKLTGWLNAGTNNKLTVLAYNDSVVIYNGKPLVSHAGGTWYRSRLMQIKLNESFTFSTITDSSFIVHEALKGKIKIILKQNPLGLIYHTIQVEKNGFILSLLSATKFDRRKYFTYFGKRAYEKYIAD